MPTSAIASRMSGNDIIASTTRITGASRRRKKPATRPSSVPASTEPSGGQQRDRQREAAAEGDAREQVAAELVGAEQVLGPKAGAGAG